ncbi:MAG: class II aldolase/adducin family protein [Proteobacteria bacterium]|nr:class II aldolase/adducin family protein [Pseudomonadota bacterium]
MEKRDIRKEVADNYEVLLSAGVIRKDGGSFSMQFEGELYFPDGQTGPSDLYGKRIDEKLPEQTPAWCRLHQYLYRQRKDIRVLLTSRLSYTMTAACAGHEVPPLLDDFAQLVGVTARVVYVEPTDPVFFRKILKGMRRRNAVLIPQMGGLCAAASFEDTLAVSQVLEKGCRAYIDTAFLGGGFRISWIESWLMRLVFKFKYSNLKNKLSGS